MSVSLSASLFFYAAMLATGSMWGKVVVSSNGEKDITVLYRDYAHPNCMLQSSLKWDGLNFEYR